jgi:hypothetical protein
MHKIFLTSMLHRTYLRLKVMSPGDVPEDAPRGSKTMATGFEDMQKFSKDQVDVAMASIGAFSKGMQALASEAADYSRTSFEAGGAAMEKLLSAQSLDKAVAVQSDFVRSAYEGYVGAATKFGEIVAEMAKTAYKPYEGLVGKFGK